MCSKERLVISSHPPHKDGELKYLHDRGFVQQESKDDYIILSNGEIDIWYYYDK